MLEYLGMFIKDTMNMLIIKVLISHVFANFTILDTQVNKAISDDAPYIYFGKVVEQCKNGDIAFGNISSIEGLKKNLEENAIPENIVSMNVNDYDEFLRERRILMAKLVEQYYKNL